MNWVSFDRIFTSYLLCPMLLRSSEVKSPADAERIKQCSTSSYVNVITEPYEIKLAYRTSMCGYLGFSVDVSYHVSGLINF